MKTKDKILARALELFNEKGSSHVTTNLIAKELGISPGNLYYHFRNKVDIIQQLYENMLEEVDEGFLRINPEVCFDKESCLMLIQKQFEFLIRIHVKYLFIAREFPQLVNGDESLRRLFLQQQESRLQDIQNNLRLLVELKVLRPMEEEEILKLANLIWMTVIFWNPLLALQGRKISPKDVAQGIQHLQTLIYPNFR